MYYFSKTNIIAHRGASSLAKRENTLEAFRLAIKLKADYVEFDVRRTKDKKIIVHHDPDINGRKLCELTYDEICELTKKEDYTIPLLSDVLFLCRDKIRLDIELKEAGYEKEVIRMVTKIFSYDRFLMKSFLDKAVANIKRHDPRITAGLLLGVSRGNAKTRLFEYFPLKRVRACHADFVSPNFRLATPDFIRRMQRQHIGIYVWTVNRAKLMAYFLKHNVDGIITDRPDKGISVRKKYIRKGA